MLRAIRMEVARLSTLPMLLLALVFVAAPSIIGVSSAQAYVYQAPIDLFRLMVSSPVSLVFPLLLTGLYVFRFSALVQNRYAFYARMRLGTTRFLAAHIAVNAAVVGALVFLSYLVGAVVAYLVLPDTNLVKGMAGYQPLPLVAVGEYSGKLMTFTQLSRASTPAYVAVFSAFVALFSVVIATASLCFTLVTRSRILGLAATLILYTVENFVLAYAGLETYRTIAAIFPGSIVQQPLWVPTVPLAGWTLLTIALLNYVRRRADQLDTLS